jgi:ribonuclease BN (tRNA processing enzyme)
VDGAAILVDGGSGTLARLLRTGQDPLALAGAVYSHRHLDHCADLAPLLFTMKVAGRPARWPIAAGAGFAGFLAALQDAYGGLGLDRVSLTELSIERPDEAVLPGGIVLRTGPANHDRGALHLRFEHGGRSLVFSGDTGPSATLEALAAHADVLVCECALPAPDPASKHLCAEEVAAICRAARPGRVLLTHLYPGTDAEAAVRTVAATGVAVRRAEDGDSLTV